MLSENDLIEVRSVLLHWAVEALLAELRCVLSAESAVHSGPTGRCNTFLVEGVRAQFWASVRHLGRCFPAFSPARVCSVLLHWAVEALSDELRCDLSAESAVHSGPTGRCNNYWLRGCALRLRRAYAIFRITGFFQFAAIFQNSKF